MLRFAFTLSLAIAVLAAASPVSGQPAAAGAGFDDCILRWASRAPSPQAAVILQRACFYKHLYGKGYMRAEGLGAEHRRMSRTYTPGVCDCIFEKMPHIAPGVPAASVLDYCVKNPAAPAAPSAR